MKNNIEFEQELKGAYIVDKELLEKLEAIIIRSTSSPGSFEVKLVDGQTIKTESVADIIDDYSVTSSGIEKIYVFFNSDDLKGRIVLNFYPSSPIRVVLEGRRPEVMEVARILKVEFEARTAWGHSLKRFQAKYGLGVGLLWLVVMSLTIIFSIEPPKDRVVYSYVGNILASASLILGVHLFVCWYMPSLIFDIGAKGRKYRAMRSVVYFLLMVVAAGVAVNLFSSWLWTKIEA